MFNLLNLLGIGAHNQNPNEDNKGKLGSSPLIIILIIGIILYGINKLNSPKE